MIMSVWPYFLSSISVRFFLGQLGSWCSADSWHVLNTDRAPRTFLCDLGALSPSSLTAALGGEYHCCFCLTDEETEAER